MDKVFDPTTYSAAIAASHTALETLHAEKHGGISRFGSVDTKGNVLFTASTVCFAEFSHMGRVHPQSEAFVFVCYNRPRDGKEAMSRRWLEFLLHPDESPWKSLFPYFVSIDPDVVESTGFIVYTETDCPGDLLYNFFIASRQAYEYPLTCDGWITLQDKLNLSPRFAAAVSTGFVVDLQPQRILIRPEGYRKEGRVYIRDQWGDKKYFDAEYEYKYPDVVDPKAVKFKRVGGNNHTYYSGIDACYGIGNASPRVLGKGGTFRERQYGWKNNRASWDIWTAPNIKPQNDRWGDREPPPAYHKLALDFDTVINYCKQLIGENK
jgi:hypothetical protein